MMRITVSLLLVLLFPLLVTVFWERGGEIEIIAS